MEPASVAKETPTPATLLSHAPDQRIVSILCGWVPLLAAAEGCTADRGIPYRTYRYHHLIRILQGRLILVPIFGQFLGLDRRNRLFFRFLKSLALSREPV